MLINTQGWSDLGAVGTALSTVRERDLWGKPVQQLVPTEDDDASSTQVLTEPNMSRHVTGSAFCTDTGGQQERETTFPEMSSQMPCWYKVLIAILFSFS